MTGAQYTSRKSAQSHTLSADHMTAIQLLCAETAQVTVLQHVMAASSKIALQCLHSKVEGSTCSCLELGA